MPHHQDPLQIGLPNLDVVPGRISEHASSRPRRGRFGKLRALGLDPPAHLDNGGYVDQGVGGSPLLSSSDRGT